MTNLTVNPAAIVNDSVDTAGACYEALVDAHGRLDIRLVGVDPFAVQGTLRRAGFERIRVWAEGPGQSGEVHLQVTAVLHDRG